LTGVNFGTLHGEVETVTISGVAHANEALGILPWGTGSVFVFRVLAPICLRLTFFPTTREDGGPVMMAVVMLSVVKILDKGDHENFKKHG
jgi:hypothetical protein